MNKDTVIVIFQSKRHNLEKDIEIPLDISANDLVMALNSAYHLQIDISDIKNCYLKMDNPIAFLHGNKTLREYNVRDGSIVIFDK